MDFGQAIKTCLNNYATFTGRAGRAEYWWFVLFNFLVTMAASVVWHRLGNLAALILLVPLIAVGTRRLHDIGKSGWFQLLWFVPVIGFVLLVIWMAQKGDAATNEYGPPVGTEPVVAPLPPGAV